MKIYYQVLIRNMFFNRYYTENKELKEQLEYYSKENFIKERKYRSILIRHKELLKENEELNKQYKELLKKYEELKTKKNGRGRPRKEVNND